MKTFPTPPTSNYALQSNFANLAGEIAESFAFSRTIGQIYGFLYASPHPVSLDEIAIGVGISKSNASINLRILENWDAVKPVWVKGTRRDYYEANPNLKVTIINRVKEGLTKRFEKIEHAVQNLNSQYDFGHSAVPDSKFMRERLAELENLVNKAQKAVSLLPQLEKFL